MFRVANMECKSCEKVCNSHDYRYVQTLPPHVARSVPWVSVRAAYGMSITLIILMRNNCTAQEVSRNCRAGMKILYEADRATYHAKVMARTQYAKRETSRIRTSLRCMYPRKQM